MSDGLKGKRIVNTRASVQARGLDDLLRAHGAIPISYPCLRIVPPDDLAPLDLALRELAAGQFDWLVLTSANTVQALRVRLDILGLKLAAESWRVAAIGPATAAAVHELLGISGVTVPGEYLTEALADHLPLKPGARVFLPASTLAEPLLAERLTARGATVCVVDASASPSRPAARSLARRPRPETALRLRSRNSPASRKAQLRAPAIGFHQRAIRPAASMSAAWVHRYRRDCANRCANRR